MLVVTDVKLAVKACKHKNITARVALEGARGVGGAPPSSSTQNTNIYHAFIALLFYRSE